MVAHSHDADGQPPHRTRQPKLDEDRARSALADSLRLQIQAVEIDPLHRKRARQARRLRFTRRLFLALLLVAAAVVVWRYAPLAEWWTAVQDLVTEAE